MSHNVNKVGDIGATREGSIPFSIDDLGNVGSVSAGQTLAYDAASASYVGFDLPAQNAAPDFALFGQGGVSDYSNSGWGISSNATWSFYDPSPINYVSSYVTFNTNAAHWLQSITLQAGKYEIMVQAYPRFSSTGYMILVLRDSANNNLSSFMRVGNVHASGASAPSAITQTLAVTEPTTDIFIKLWGWTGVHATQSTVPSQMGVVLVRRLL